MALENTQQEPNREPALGGAEDEEDLATLADGFADDEPTPDPEPEPEDQDDPEPAKDLADDVVPEEEPSAGNEQLALTDDTEVELENGESIPFGELKKIGAMYKGSKDHQAMRGAYLRAREELSKEKKQFEAERAPLAQAYEQLTNMRIAFENDPVAYGFHAFKLGAQDGIVDQGLVEAIGAVIEEYAQTGKYNPHALQARAAQMQAQRQAEKSQEEQRRLGFERELWNLQGQIGRIMTEEERGLLVNAWNHLAVTSGKRPTLEEAWKLVQQHAKPLAPQKPVAQPSPRKVVQQLRKPKPATTERAGGSSRGSGYSKADLDRDLDLIARI